MQALDNDHSKLPPPLAPKGQVPCEYKLQVALHFPSDDTYELVEHYVLKEAQAAKKKPNLKGVGKTMIAINAMKAGAASPPVSPGAPSTSLRASRTPTRYSQHYLRTSARW